jgi:hypothetical protein
MLNNVRQNKSKSRKFFFLSGLILNFRLIKKCFGFEIELLRFLRWFFPLILGKIMLKIGF